MDLETKFEAFGIAVVVLSFCSTVLTIFGLTNIAIGFEIAAWVMFIGMIVTAVKFLRG